MSAYLLAFIDLVSFGVYADLYLVNRFQAHIFTPLMKRMDKHRLKKFQQLYYSTLQRNYFCVMDKVSSLMMTIQVDVSGTTFALVFAALSLISFILNLVPHPVIPVLGEDGSFKNETLWIFSPYLHFYLLGLPYLIYVLFCLHTYRAARELCFYCRYALLQPACSLALMAVFTLDNGLPRMFIWLTLILLLGTLLIRGLKRQQRAKLQQKVPRRLDEFWGVEDSEGLKKN